MKNPIFKHDCNKCKFITTDKVDRRLSDVYACGDSLIVRNSDEPSDYGSYRLGTPEYLFIAWGLK